DSNAQQQYQTQSAGSSNSKYASRNNSVSTLDRHPQNSSASSSSPNASTHTSNSSSLQKALSRRRSSNRTAESGSSHGSSGLSSNHQHNHLLPHDSQLASHQEEGEGDFKWYHGRRYHNTPSLYMLPNDSQEVD
ncbi:hypothetical protein BGZ65_009865, partial [Modicella reniformis]